MQVTREDLNPCTIKLSIVCAPEQVIQGYDRAYRQASKKMKLPGFRPGMAPKHLVKQNAIPDVIKEMAAENIVNSAFGDALKSEKIEMSGQPTIRLSEIDEDSKKCVFEATVPLAPQVEVGDYKGLEVEKTEVVVTDAEVTERLEDLRARKAKTEAVTDRGVHAGDSVVVAITPEGHEGEGRSFMVIAGSTFKSLDGALLGMSAEQMKQVELSFPKDYQVKEWAGKKLSCHVTVRSLSSRTLPALDDDFAQTHKAKDLEEMKKLVRQAIQENKDEVAEDFVNEMLLDALLSKSKVHVADNMWEQVAQRRLQDIAYEQSQQGKKMEQYAEEQGMTIEQLVDAQNSEAKLYVERAILVREIFQKEKMQLTNQDINTELLLMAREYNIAPAELLTVLRKNNAVEDLHYRAIYKKVTQFLSQHAKFKKQGA